MKHKSKWWSSMIAKHGSKEAVRRAMSESAKKRGDAPRYAYFKRLKESDPELLKELQRRGGSK
jgi:hypothetical protein